MFRQIYAAMTFILGMSLFSIVHAQVAYSMPALEIGFKLNTMDADNATSNKQTQAFQAGGSLVFDLGANLNFGLKTGLMYSERTFENQYTGPSTTEGKITYFDIPLHLMFKLEDYAGIYFGPSFSTKLGDEAKSSNGSAVALTNIKSTIVPITFGAQFKFAPQFGLNLFFETVSGELAQNLKSSRAVGANFLFTFD